MEKALASIKEHGLLLLDGGKPMDHSARSPQEALACLKVGGFILCLSTQNRARPTTYGKNCVVKVTHLQ